MPGESPSESKRTPGFPRKQLLNSRQFSVASILIATVVAAVLFSVLRQIVRSNTAVAVTAAAYFGFIAAVVLLVTAKGGPRKL